MSHTKDESRKMELLSYPSSIKNAEKIQAKWSQLFWEKYMQNDSGIINSINSLSEVNTVAGVDISYSKKNPNYGICCAVLWDISKNKEINISYSEGNIEFMYKPGLLAFREAHLSSKAINGLEDRPDVILFDGHG
ncbi:MAG: hypothetical protein GF364_18350, partial [Candidatus Lokiarchaeota archaeon]|nr:hypothetical protein [Candidatus Lokiarchaeota archaeon]